MNFVICNKSNNCFQQDVIYECSWTYNGMVEILSPDKELIVWDMDDKYFTFIFNADKMLQDYIFGAYDKWNYEEGCVEND